MSTVLETKYAVVMGVGRHEMAYSPFHKEFIPAPLGLNLLDEETAENVARREGGRIVELVVRDSGGPCCYRMENIEDATHEH